MRLGMPLPGQTANFDVSERTNRDLSHLIQPELIPDYERPPDRVLEFTDDSRYSDKQLLKMVGKDKLIAPDDTVSNFISITREENYQGEKRRRKERLEFKKQSLVMTRRERERLPSFDAPDENAPTSIREADPTARMMLEWMGRGTYHDFA